MIFQLHESMAKTINIKKKAEQCIGLFRAYLSQQFVLLEPEYLENPELNHVQILSFASMAPSQVAIKHDFVAKVSGGCSS